MSKSDSNGPKNSSTTERQIPPPRPALPPSRVKSPDRKRLPQHHDHESSANEENGQSSRLQQHAADSNLRPEAASRERKPLSPTVTRRINCLMNNSQQQTGTGSTGGGPGCKPTVPPQKPATPKKPAVARKPSNVASGDTLTTGVVSNPVYGGFPKKTSFDAVTDTYAKVNKERRKGSSPERSIKSSVAPDDGNIHRREAIRKAPADRRQTVASIDPEMLESSGDSGDGVSVAMRTKLFDAGTNSKPTPPKKSAAVRSMSMRTSREHEEEKQRNSGDNSKTDHADTEEIYEPPWDISKNAAMLERLSQVQVQPKQCTAIISAATPPPNMPVVDKPKPPPLPSQPPPLPSQPPPKPGGRRRVPSEKSSAPNSSKPVSKVSEASKDSASKDTPAKPPPKPPRTHAHDSYILTKITQQEAEGGLHKTVQILETPAPPSKVSSAQTSALPTTQTDNLGSQEDVEYFSVKDRIAKMNSSSDPQSPAPSSPPLKPKSAAAKSSQPAVPEVVMRHKPPTRPPPPKRRPSSSGSNTSIGTPPPRPLTQCPAGLTRPTTSSGPIIIPVFPRGQQQQLKHPFHRQVSATHDNRASRNPTDVLPAEPDMAAYDDSDYGFRPIKRFPLRKSYSSECLHSSCGSSLNLSTGATWGDEAPWSQDTMSRSSCDYEAVIDGDGYAVPNEFMKLPSQKKPSDKLDIPSVKISPIQFLTKLKGFEGGSSTGSNSSSKDGAPAYYKQDLTKVNKKKMIMVREKINQAYASLDFVSYHSQADMCEDSPPDPPPNSRPESGELIVETTELKRRIEHCTTVRLKSSKSIKRSKEYLTAIYPQLFEYCLLVGLRPLNNAAGYEPYLIHKFPENVSSNLSIPSFCFPDASVFKPGSALYSESYSFVMTYADGSRVYGYCRRIQPPDCSLPEVICIISPIDAFNMYNTLLSEIEARRRISSDLAMEVIAASFGRPLPKPGKVCHIRTLDSEGEMETIFLNRPTDNRLDDVNYESPLFYLGTDKLVKVFSSMLMERRIILCSSNLSVLTQTVHALSALLYPFHWQHVYVPLLPAEMLDVVCAPMPYIVGVLSAFLPNVLDMDTEEVFIVDLDKKNIVKSHGDESTILPRKVQRALKTAINMCKIDSDAQNAQWLMVAEAFLRMFIETIGHFTNHVRTQQDGNRIFQKEGFILEMMSKEMRQFLEWFTETQMFEVFIVDLVEKSETWTSDLFMQRLREHRESKEETNRRKGLGAKVKNFGKALKTKLQAA